MTATNEDILEALKLNVLDEQRAFLCHNLTPKDHYPYLRSRRILSEDDEELIELQQLRKQKVHKFLDILRNRGPQAYKELVNSLLVEKTQVFVVEKLNKAYEEKRKRYYALLSAQNQTDVNSRSSNGVTPSHVIRSEKMATESSTTSPEPSKCKQISFPELSIPLNSLPIPVMLGTDNEGKVQSKKIEGMISLCGPKSVDENDEDSSVDGSQGYKDSDA